MLSTLPCSAFLYLVFFGTVSSLHPTSFYTCYIYIVITSICMHVHTCMTMHFQDGFGGMMPLYYLRHAYLHCIYMLCEHIII